MGGPAAIAIDDLGGTAAAFLAVAGCAWATTRTEGRIRLAWALLAVAAVGWTAGEAARSVYEVWLAKPAPYPGWPDAGFLAAMPFAFAGIRAFWREPRDAASRWRVWLDAAIIFVALTFSVWTLGLRVSWVADSGLQRLADAAYTVGDLLIATVLILALRRATRRRAARVLILLAAIAAISVADAGGALDALRFAGYLVVAVTAVWPRTATEQVSDDSPVDLWQLSLPWITVLAGGLCSIALFVTGQEMDQFLTLLAGVVVILLTLTMILSSRDFFRMLVKRQASEATLAEVIAQAPTGVVRLGADLRIMDANPRFLALLDSSHTEAGRPITGLFGDVDAARFAEQIEALRSGAEAVEGEAWTQHGEGTRAWVRWRATAVRNADGDCDYFIAMFEDRTARHEAEAAAASSLELMQRLNALKTEFLQSVSHEFKTALIGIQGFSEFMRDADQLDVNDARAFAADIYRDAERLDRMVTEMIALDRVETTRANMRVAAVDINKVIEREVTAAQAGASARILAELSPQLPRVAGDDEKLGLVVRTLLANAIKYSPDGGRITVTTAASGETVTVSVKDEGVAARADFDNRLFGRDELYANNPIRKVVGTGLGLGIVRQVVEMHGGRLWADQVDGGSVFHFTLQAMAASPAPHENGGMVA
jgi:PAS domain S-box-containing protein